MLRVWSIGGGGGGLLSPLWGYGHSEPGGPRPRTFHRSLGGLPVVERGASAVPIQERARRSRQAQPFLLPAAAEDPLCVQGPSKKASRAGPLLLRPSLDQEGPHQAGHVVEAGAAGLPLPPAAFLQKASELGEGRDVHLRPQAAGRKGLRRRGGELDRCLARPRQVPRGQAPLLRPDAVQEGPAGGAQVAEADASSLRA